MRVPNGVNRDRLSLILAVLSKHTGVKPFAVNVHTNVVGGMTMRCGATLAFFLSLSLQACSILEHFGACTSISSAA